MFINVTHNVCAYSRKMSTVYRLLTAHGRRQTADLRIHSTFALDAAGGIRLTLIGDMHWSARDIISL